MTSVLAFKGKSPVIPDSVYLADGSRIIGDVELGEECSVWFNAVVRGDVHSVRIGRGTNIQDNATVHVTHDRAALRVGDFVTVGHGAILHGCSVQDRVLVGMGAILLDHAEVGSGSIVAAGSLLREGSVVPSGVLVAGRPATVRRDLTETERSSIEDAAVRYVQYARSYRLLKQGAGQQ